MIKGNLNYTINSMWIKIIFTIFFGSLFFFLIHLIMHKIFGWVIYGIIWILCIFTAYSIILKLSKIINVYKKEKRVPKTCPCPFCNKEIPFRSKECPYCNKKFQNNIVITEKDTVIAQGIFDKNDTSLYRNSFGKVMMIVGFSLFFIPLILLFVEYPASTSLEILGRIFHNMYTCILCTSHPSVTGGLIEEIAHVTISKSDLLILYGIIIDSISFMFYRIKG